MKGVIQYRDIIESMGYRAEGAGSKPSWKEGENIEGSANENSTRLILCLRRAAWYTGTDVSAKCFGTIFKAPILSPETSVNF